MPIQPPKWAKGAVPTSRGWVRNGEVLVSKKFSQKQIDEFWGVETATAVEQIVEPEPVVQEAPQMLREAPVNNTTLEDMTKADLVALAEQHGITFPVWKSKAAIVEDLKEIV